MNLGQLILRKIIKIVATRCQILRLKCNKSKGRGRRREKKGREGRRGKKRKGETRHTIEPILPRSTQMGFFIETQCIDVSKLLCCRDSWRSREGESADVSRRGGSGRHLSGSVDRHPRHHRRVLLLRQQLWRHDDPLHATVWPAAGTRQGEDRWGGRKVWFTIVKIKIKLPLL